MDETPIRVLLIEDNPKDVRLMEELLADAEEVHADLESTDCLSAALERLRQGRTDLVLLDLGLPDCQGIDTFNRLHAEAPNVPVIILTGLQDEKLAVRAIQLGAQDYLKKAESDSPSLARAMRYAIERHNLLARVRELEALRRMEQRHREMNSLERLATPGSGAGTTPSAGPEPLSSAAPELFEKLVGQYESLLDMVIEEKIHKGADNVSEQLRAMAEKIGRQEAGPRDVVHVHSSVLKRKVRGATEAKAQACIEEARLMVLELMGYLATFYRDHAVVITAAPADGAPEAEGASETEKGELL
jgi:DNA-binding NarL/FixJ family response regulator